MNCVFFQLQQLTGALASSNSSCVWREREFLTHKSEVRCGVAGGCVKSKKRICREYGRESEMSEGLITLSRDSSDCKSREEEENNHFVQCENIGENAGVFFSVFCSLIAVNSAQRKIKIYVSCYVADLLFLLTLIENQNFENSGEKCGSDEIYYDGWDGRNAGEWETRRRAEHWHHLQHSTAPTAVVYDKYITREKKVNFQVEETSYGLLNECIKGLHMQVRRRACASGRKYMSDCSR